MKKLFGIVFILLLCAVIVSCSERAGVVSFISETDTLDLGGYEMTVYTAQHMTNDFYTYGDGTTNFDYMQKKIKGIENNLNVVLNYEAWDTDTNPMFVQILSDTGAGLKTGDIFFLMDTSTKLASAGLVQPITDYPVIDLSDSFKYGSVPVLENGMYKGEIYGVYPAAWPECKLNLYSYTLLCYNGRLINKAGKTDPREYVENGTWNWDTFSDVLETYGYIEGETQIYSLQTTWQNQFLESLAFGNGYKYVIRQDDGTYINGLKSKNFREAAEYYNTLFKKFGTKYLYNGSAYENFENNTVMIAQYAFNHFQGLTFEMEEFGILPFPCGPSGTYGEWPIALEDVSMFSISTMTNEPDSCAKVISELCEPFEEYPDDAALYAQLDNLLFDETDMKIFHHFLDNAQYTHQAVKMVIGDIRTQLSSGKTPTEAIQRLANTADDYVNTYVLPNAEKMYEMEKNGD